MVERMKRPAYRRLDVDEIAREAGISKALLYHYFPSKQAFFQATLEQAAQELRARTEPDPDLPPLDQLRGSLDGFLDLIEENALAYRKLMQSATSVPEVNELVNEIRERTAERILAGLFPKDAPPAARIAVHGWLWFMDGACLQWIDQDERNREQLRDQLLGTLLGALTAADALPEVTLTPSG
jgi:AcrR family transcriptional regulator